MKKLYWIINDGCDDYTQGLVELTDEELESLKTIFINLNKNSTYGCMPTISMYEISWDEVERVYEEGRYSATMYYQDKMYKIKKTYDENRKRII